MLHSSAGGCTRAARATAVIGEVDSFAMSCASRHVLNETTMPELLIGFITSLDCYAAADGWPGWWGLEGPEYLAWLGESPEADYTVLMGANTYHLSHVWKRRDRT